MENKDNGFLDGFNEDEFEEEEYGQIHFFTREQLDPEGEAKRQKFNRFIKWMRGEYRAPENMVVNNEKMEGFLEDLTAIKHMVETKDGFMLPGEVHVTPYEGAECRIEAVIIDVTAKGISTTPEKFAKACAHADCFSMCYPDEELEVEDGKVWFEFIYTGLYRNAEDEAPRTYQ